MKRLLLAGVVIGVAALAVKKCSRQRDQWHGLSEADAREKLDHRLPSQMPDERRAAVTDKIIGRMRDRGVLIADPEFDDANHETDLDIDLTARPVELTDDTTPKVG